MSGFSTPDQLAAHLREMVDDEAWIWRTVQMHFPDTQPRLKAKEELRRRYENERKQTQTRKLRATDVGLAENYAFHRSIEEGTTALLLAIHRQHPSVMQALAAQGRTVVYP